MLLQVDDAFEQAITDALLTVINGSEKQQRTFLQVHYPLLQKKVGRGPDKVMQCLRALVASAPE